MQTDAPLLAINNSVPVSIHNVRNSNCLSLILFEQYSSKLMKMVHKIFSIFDNHTSLLIWSVNIGNKFDGRRFWGRFGSQSGDPQSQAKTGSD